MSYFLTDIKKIYKSKITKVMLALLFIIMIADPISVYFKYGRNEKFVETIGKNGFQFWLLMNSRSWGFNVYHSLLMIFPVLSTALILYSEQRSSMYEFLITRDSKIKYYLSKIFSVFFATFINFFILFSINVFVTSIFFPFDAVCTGIIKNYIPKVGMFSYPFYEHNPLSMVFLFVFLNAFTIALLALFALAFHMIVKLKNKYMAILTPFIVLYLTTYLMGIILEQKLWNYDFMLIIQPMVGAMSKNIISSVDVLIVFGLIIVIDTVLLIGGYIRNRESL